MEEAFRFVEEALESARFKATITHKNSIRMRHYLQIYDYAKLFWFLVYASSKLIISLSVFEIGGS